jgi:hypothetical protein
MCAVINLVSLVEQGKREDADGRAGLPRRRVMRPQLN